MLTRIPIKKIISNNKKIYKNDMFSFDMGNAKKSYKKLPVKNIYKTSSNRVSRNEKIN